MWLPSYWGHLWWQARASPAAEEPVLLSTCGDGGERRSLAPTWLSTSATGKARGQADPRLSHGSPLKFPESPRHLHQMPQTLYLQRGAIASGTRTLPMALCGVAGIPYRCSPGELLGCVRTSSMPRFPPGKARHPSPAGLLVTRMVYLGGHCQQGGGWGKASPRTPEEEDDWGWCGRRPCHMADVTWKTKGVGAGWGERYCKREEMAFVEKNDTCFFPISQAVCLLNVAFAAKGLVILH